MIKAVVTVPKITINENSKIVIYIPKSFVIEESKLASLNSFEKTCCIDNKMVSWQGYDYLVRFEKFDKPVNIYLQVDLELTDNLTGSYQISKFN